MAQKFPPIKRKEVGPTSPENLTQMVAGLAAGS